MAGWGCTAHNSGISNSNNSSSSSSNNRNSIGSTQQTADKRLGWGGGFELHKFLSAQQNGAISCSICLFSPLFHPPSFPPPSSLPIQKTGSCLWECSASSRVRTTSGGCSRPSARSRSAPSCEGLMGPVRVRAHTPPTRFPLSVPLPPSVCLYVCRLSSCFCSLHLKSHASPAVHSLTSSAIHSAPE